MTFNLSKPPIETSKLRWQRIAIPAMIFAAAAIAQNPVIDWNAIAVDTALAGNQTISPGSNTAGGAAIYLAYVHLAVYDAVNSISNRFQPFIPAPPAPTDASEDAAAIAAAYGVLAHYFPDQAAALAPKYALSLSAIPDGSQKNAGIQAGIAAANNLIASRLNDGRGATVPYLYPLSPVPGVWIPTPPAFLPPQTPWVGEMKPLTMTTPWQFLPEEPPTSLGSAQWADDYSLTKTLGAVNSTVRTPEQTEVGLFWTEHTARQYARAFRALAASAGLNTEDTARLFAMLWASYADSFIGCMNAKYTFSFWRPVTAIRNGDIDGNPDTVPDTAWTPLATTPNHPEYPAAHGCVTGSVANALKGFFGTPNVSLSVSSTVTGKTHTFSSVHELETEVEWARIYAGFHYHHSLVQGFVLGHKVASQVVHEYFRQLRGGN